MTLKTEGDSPIFTYELCAAILKGCIANRRRGETARTCVLCFDSKAAVSALVKGSSPSDLSGVLVTLFWNVASRGTTRRWVGYADTRPNYADFP